MEKKKRLYLVDGANYIFRAYYALPPLSNSKGLPTNALYGYAQMLLKLLKEESPDYIAVCFDTPEATFRDEMYDKYKANRKEPPDDLVPQFPYVQPLTKALGLAVVERPGFEADDLIGTLARRFEGEGLEIVIVSGDKDLMQLVTPNVTLLDEMKGVRMGPDEVLGKFGVGPEGVSEVLGLAGDSSDNVPGVSGVGLKTAMKIIAEYGTVERAIENAARIKGAVGRKIAEQADMARLSLRLVKIDTQVPLECCINDFIPGKPGSGCMRDLFKELEFTKLLPETAPVSNLSHDKYRLILKESDLKNLINTLKNKGIISIDLETTSLDVMRAEIVGFAIAWGPGEAAYIPVGHRPSSGGELFGTDGGIAPSKQLPMDLVFDCLRPLLSDEKIRKVGQNLNYDLTILKRLGFDVSGVSFDTMLASYVLNPTGNHGLDSLAEEHLDHRTIRYEEVVGKGKSQKNFSEIEPECARDYACEDADVAFRLYGIFRPKIEGAGFSALFYGMEMPLLNVLVDMQIAGMRVDGRKLADLDVDLSRRIAGLEKDIHGLAGVEFNVSSPKQLGVVLFDRLNLPGSKRTKAGYSTSQSVLEELASEHEIVRKVLDYRRLSKLKSTYVDALGGLIDPATGRVHTSFNQARTATGRLSSSDPNLQNIPARTEDGRKIREAFVADEGFIFLSADYSQIELRMLAHMSHDPALVSAFKGNVDVHAMTASGIFGVPYDRVTKEQRAVGKTVNFSTIYGQTAYGLSRQLGIDVVEAERYIENYFRKYPRVAEYRDEVLKRAGAEGKVETLFGRRRLLPDMQSQNKQLKQVAERMAFNTVFQGSAADVIKLAMISIHRGLKGVSGRARLLLQVHDELVFEVPVDDVDRVKEFVIGEMEGVAPLDVPLIVDVGVGPNWAEAH